MKQTNLTHVARACHDQRGYSLIELMVAITIAVFLLGGLFSILQSTRMTSTNQTALAQLQDDERIEMTLVQETLQTAGYFPSPATQSAATALPASGNFVAGQSVYGVANTSTSPVGIGDTVWVRYQSDATGGSVLGCLGTSDPVGIAHTYEFLVQDDPTTSTTVSSLYCSVDGGTAVLLVPNVSGMTVLYGVDTTGTGTGVNAYVGETGMAGYWLNVYSIRITLDFPNPLAGQPGQSNNPIAFTRVINLMSRTGGNTDMFN
jgi:type IV pilus assembly protein PilW